MAKKMALVPIDMLSMIKRSHEDLTPLTNPNKDQVLKKMGHVTDILQDEQLPEDIKTSRLNEEINKYSIFANKLLKPLSIEKTTPAINKVTVVPDDILSSIPKTYHASAKVLLDKLRKHPKLIKWSPLNHEVEVRGRKLKGSNIVDLVNNVIRTRKNIPDPVYGDTFLKVLADLNLPEELVKNKKHINKFRSLKQKFDESGDDGNISEDDGVSEIEKRSPYRIRVGRKGKKRRIEWSPMGK
jgi:hypothetical protein